MSQNEAQTVASGAAPSAGGAANAPAAGPGAAGPVKLPSLSVGPAVSAPWLRAFRRSALALGIFCVLGAVLLAGRQLSAGSGAPLNSELLAQLKVESFQKSDDEALKDRIRVLDAQMRREYFGRLTLFRSGAWLLLVGAVLAAAAWKVAAQGAETLPDPRQSPAPDPERTRTAARLAVGAVGVVLGAALVLAVLRPWHREAVAVPAETPRVAEAPAASPMAHMQHSPDKTPAVKAAPAEQATAAAPAVEPKQVESVKPMPTPKAPPAAPPVTPPVAAPKAAEPVHPAPTPKGPPPAPAAGGITVEEWAKNWPVFRGPQGNPVVGEGPWPTKWDGATMDGVLWKTKIPGGGESSPVLWGNRIYVTGLVKDNCEVFCFDADSGKLLWETPVPSKGELADTGNGASPTAASPVAVGSDVFAVFGNGELACLDKDGNIAWQKNLGGLLNQYHYAASLTFWKGSVIAQLDVGGEGAAEAGLYAFEAATGKEKWKTKRDQGESWSSPTLIQTPTGPQLVCAGPDVQAYNPDTGKEIWRADGLLGGDLAPSPAAFGGVVYVVMENVGLSAIKTNGKGNVTKTHVPWSQKEGAFPDTGSPVSDGQLVFTASSKGTVICTDAKNGEKVWDKDIDGGEFYPTPVLAGGTLYLFGNDGTVYLLSAEKDKNGEELGKCKLGEGGVATPVFHGGRIYARGDKNLFCIGAKK